VLHRFHAVLLHDSFLSGLMATPFSILYLNTTPSIDAYGIYMKNVPAGFLKWSPEQQEEEQDE